MDDDPFLTLDDQTEIVHSEMLEGGTVKVYMEKPDEQPMRYDINFHIGCLKH